jgi:hypothetical protein
MNIGKLYQVKKFYWFLYPSKDKAAAVTVAGLRVHAHPAAAASYSKRFNCNISYIEPSIFLLLEQDGEFIKILSANGEVGWIYLNNFFEDDIKEINQ